jgi:hypothetical protein
MTLWNVTIVLAIVVACLTYFVIRLAGRVDNLEAWVLPHKEREEKAHQLERLRAAVEQGFRDGIMVPDEILRQAYPENYPAEESKPPDDSSV